ncbi:MAG: Ig-like domain-containing protein [Kaistella sp.]|nr:Ig-like domain-containing protein [Kaistella sp.]
MKKLFFLFVLNLLLLSCARVGSPIGGDKDTLAPKFLSSNIDTTRVNVPQNIRQLRLDFDEYVTLKDVSKNLIISPPIKKITKILPSGLANKYVLIQWEDTLQANTTYNFNFGNAIADQNEGNTVPYFNFAFSTGDKIDDLYISGEVKDAFKIKENTTKKNMVVGLYKQSDSADYRQKPYYITKVDDDGYYELNYLSPGSYTILAFVDENENSVYDPGKENIGFQKETVVLEKSISGLNIKTYPSKKALKYNEMKEIPGGILMTFEGNPQDLKVLSINDQLKDYKVTHVPKSDSARIWFDAKDQKVGLEANENLKFSYDADGKKDTVSLFYRYNTKNEMTINNQDGNLLEPFKDFRFVSNYLIDKIEPEKWILKSDSLTTETFTARISAENPYQVWVNSDFKAGKKYQLTVPKGSVSSFYESTDRSYRFDFELDKVENFGSLTLKLINKPAQKFWLQLLSPDEKIMYSKFTDAAEVKFDILKPGDYFVRILVDNNGNGYWDEADFKNRIFAEDAYTFYKKINIKALWEIKEDWDLTDKRTLDSVTQPAQTVPKTPVSKELGEIKGENSILVPQKK